MTNLKTTPTTADQWSDAIQWTTLCHANHIINGDMMGDKASAFALRAKIDNPFAE